MGGKSKKQYLMLLFYIRINNSMDQIKNKKIRKLVNPHKAPCLAPFDS